MSKQVTVGIIGLGVRGRDVYAHCQHIFPQRMKITAIADTDPEKVKAVAEEYGIPADNCFYSADALLAREQLADILFICTQDRLHAEEAIPALRKGYHLLLEKPIAPKLNECREIAAVAKECNRQVVICHVLRYTPFYQTAKQILDSGRIGQIIAIQAMENVAYWHFAHSYVRGNWRDVEKSSPLILQKSCHDTDILLWLSGQKCERVTSFGRLSYFRPEYAPAGSASRCLDCGIQKSCPYDAEKIYVTCEATGVRHGHTDWPCDVLAFQPTEESIYTALREGPYGRCVYQCDNNVVDHQTVDMEMADGSTISFTVSAFTEKCYRNLKVTGSLGEIEGDTLKNLLYIREFGKPEEVIDIAALEKNLDDGHGGGDERMIDELLNLFGEEKEPSGALTSIEQSVESHYVALAAEESRLHSGRSITLDRFVESGGKME